MVYLLWYLYEDIRQKYKAFVSYEGAYLFKTIIEKNFKEKYPHTYHLITFYIIKDNDPVYEIWWVYKDGIEDLSDCGEFYTKRDVNMAILEEQCFWTHMYIDDQIEEIINVIGKEQYYNSDLPKDNDSDLFKFLDDQKN